MMLGPCFLPAVQSAIKHVAIAVGPSRPNVFNTFFHTVLLYRHSNGEVCGLDIDISGMITSDANRQPKKAANYAWAVPIFEDDVEGDVLENIASFCESMGNEPRRFTYAFNHTSDCKIAQTKDEFVLTGTSDGFTCATLVLAIFQSFEWPLLDLASWSIKSEDTTSQENIFRVMKNQFHAFGLMTDEQLEARRREIPCVRYSPMMVIGCCRVGSHPSPCLPSLESGRECMKWLELSANTHLT